MMIPGISELFHICFRFVAFKQAIWDNVLFLEQIMHRKRTVPCRLRYFSYDDFGHNIIFVFFDYDYSLMPLCLGSFVIQALPVAIFFVPTFSNSIVST